MPVGLPLFADARPFIVTEQHDVESDCGCDCGKHVSGAQETSREAPQKTPETPEIPEKLPFLLFGIQFDNSSSFRAGSRHAPDAIRAASYNFETYNPSLDLDMCDIPVFDCGNVFEAGSIDQVRDDIETIFSAAGNAFTGTTPAGAAPLLNGFIPVMIGGEHSVSPLVAEQLKARSLSTDKDTSAKKGKSDFGIIVLDAHLDYRYSYLNDTTSHACALRRFSEIVGTNRVVSMGVRSVESRELEDADDDGIRFFTAEEMLLKGTETVLAEALEHLGTDRVYLSLDMDFFDPSFAPGVGTPEHLGLSPRDAIHIIRTLGSRIIGFDLVEVCPPCDPSGVTSILAAKIIRELLFSVAARSETLITSTLPVPSVSSVSPVSSE